MTCKSIQFSELRECLLCAEPVCMGMRKCTTHARNKIQRNRHKTICNETVFLSCLSGFPLGVSDYNLPREVTLTTEGKGLKNWAKFTLKILWSPLLSGPEILRSPPFCHIKILRSPIQGMSCILYDCTGLPRSWKSHGISGILKFSGKVMEFWRKLGWVMEKSWNFEIWAKSHGKVMEFDKQILNSHELAPLRGSLSNSS